MKNLKILLKKNRNFIKLYNFLFAKPIKNVNKRSYMKRALLSYSVYPFIKKNKNLIHPNFIESYKLNKILDELGYAVDIYNNIYDGKINFENYDLIIGEGLPISNYFLSKGEKAIKTVYYATGSHPIFNNNKSIERLIKFYTKSGKWLEKSSRIVDNKWFLGSSLSDEYILIGNQITQNSFEKYTDNKPIYTINPPFYKKVKDINLDRKRKNKFLWFGSYGLLHKGLDVVIETFLERKDLELHICGYLDGEQEFIEVYKEQLQSATNIVMHGFISVEGPVFKDLMETCSFVVLTSVAEGLATAVVTAMGNGGLIPVVTKETGIDISLSIPVTNNDTGSLNKALNLAEELTETEIIERSKYNLDFVQNNFSEQCFEDNLRRILFKIHGVEED